MTSLSQATPARQVRQWTATPRQLVFLERTEYEVLYGGAKFGLKTDVLLMWSILRRQKYARSRGLFIRRELAELTKKGAAWDRAQEILGNSVKYNQTDHTILFPNGSVLEFGHCQHDSDKFHYQGAQYDDICFDQLEQFTEDLYLYIQGACRVPLDNPPTAANGQRIEARIRASANPGDVGHVFVKRRFIDVAPAETPYRRHMEIPDPQGVPVVVDRDQVFIPSSVFDSIRAGVVGPDYLATLNDMPEPYRTAYTYGRWDIFVGQAFPEFSRWRLDPATGLRVDPVQPWHVIPTDMRLIERWRRVASHDWGHDGPGHHLWGAVDPMGGIVIYREWGFRGLDPQEIAAGVLYRQGVERITMTYGDPSMWRMQGAAYLTAEQIRGLGEDGKLQLVLANQYQDAGLFMQPANNARVSGKQRVHTILKDRGDGVPYLRIMDCCPTLIETLEGIQLDPNRAEDVITDYPADARLRDDPYDALRYLEMGVPTKAAAPAPREPVRVRWAGG